MAPFESGWPILRAKGRSLAYFPQFEYCESSVFDTPVPLPISDGANTQGFSYVYDQYGNRQQQNVAAGSGPQPQYSFNAATNRVTNNGYQYDAAGDVTNDGNCSYTWDAEGHMSSATCPPNSSTTTTYVYDAQGQRVAKEVGGAVTEADVYNTAGQVVSRYGPYPAETWLGDDVWVGGAHLAIYANGQTYFPLTDQVGTERARFASTGGIVESCISLPFGDELQCTGTDSDPYQFAKLERDVESGDDHAQHRDYNSIPGHWLSPDPAGIKVVSLTDPQTWNLYVYSGNNPVTDNDPSGLKCDHDGPCYEGTQYTSDTSYALHGPNHTLTATRVTTTMTVKPDGSATITTTTTTATFSTDKKNAGQFLGATSNSTVLTGKYSAQEGLTTVGRSTIATHSIDWGQAARGFGGSGKLLYTANEAATDHDYFSQALGHDIAAHPIRYGLHVIGFALPFAEVPEAAHAIITAVEAISSAHDLQEEMHNGANP